MVRLGGDGPVRARMTMTVLRWLAVLAFGLTVATPGAAQELQPQEPGLTIVGHGPDVPNVASATCDATATCEAVGAFGPVPPALVVIVPVLVEPARAHHRRPDHAVAGPAAAPNATTGRFTNDPSNRFVNDPSNRFVNDPSNRFINPPVPHNR